MVSPKINYIFGSYLVAVYSSLLLANCSDFHDSGNRYNIVLLLQLQHSLITQVLPFTELQKFTLDVFQFLRWTKNPRCNVGGKSFTACVFSIFAKLNLLCAINRDILLLKVLTGPIPVFVLSYFMLYKLNIILGECYQINLWKFITQSYIFVHTKNSREIFLAPDGNFGAELANRSWSGMVGIVQRKVYAILSDYFIVRELIKMVYYIGSRHWRCRILRDLRKISGCRLHWLYSPRTDRCIFVKLLSGV